MSRRKLLVLQIATFVAFSYFVWTVSWFLWNKYNIVFYLGWIEYLGLIISIELTTVFLGLECALAIHRRTLSQSFNPVSEMKLEMIEKTSERIEELTQRLENFETSITDLTAFNRLAEKRFPKKETKK